MTTDFHAHCQKAYTIVNCQPPNFLDSVETTGSPRHLFQILVHSLCTLNAKVSLSELRGRMVDASTEYNYALLHSWE
jgi:hypothetical protein